MKRTMIDRIIGTAFLFLLVFAQAHAQTDPSTALGAVRYRLGMTDLPRRRSSSS